jgi:hypothetical protein
MSIKTMRNDNMVDCRIFLVTFIFTPSIERFNMNAYIPDKRLLCKGCPGPAKSHVIYREYQQGLPLGQHYVLQPPLPPLGDSELIFATR